MVAWALIIPAALSAVSSLSSAAQQKAGGQLQSDWAKYNAFMQQRTSFNNILSENKLSLLNAKATLATGQVQAAAIGASASFNAMAIGATTEYNDLLFEEDLHLLWEQTDLDLELLAQQRARERGSIVATQAASGTVIGEGSNEDVVISQRTQEELDAFVVRHNADVQAAKIMNARAQNSWEGEMQALKVMWEGKLGATVAMTNAKIAAGSSLLGTKVATDAALQSMMFRFSSDIYGAKMGIATTDQQAQNTLTHGLFSSASQFAAGYYARKDPDLSTPGDSLLAANKNTQYDPSYAGYNQPR